MTCDALHERYQMNIAEPSDLVMSRATASVLRVLVGADASFSIRQLARLAEVSAPRAVEIVNRASERGLILVEQAGRSRMCRFNREHLAANAIIDLVTIRERILRALESEITAWSIQPLHASLFGSAARGDGGTDSDLDVLIVRPEAVTESMWDDQKYASGLRLMAKIGNAVSWFDISMAELKTASDASEPILSEWKSEGIRLSGTLLPDLLRRMSAREGS